MSLKQWVDENGRPKQPKFEYCNSILRMNGRVYVPACGELQQKILSEAHCTLYTVHPRTTKMYWDLREVYWWPGMKISMDEFVRKCDPYQRIKAEHQTPSGRLQPLQILKWKWEHVMIDFIMGLTRTPRKVDTIWVVVDWLTKSVHFLPVKNTIGVEQFAWLYIQEIVRLDGIPVSIVSNRNCRFVSNFWKVVQEELGTQLNFSMAYHPQTNG